MTVKRLLSLKTRERIGLVLLTLALAGWLAPRAGAADVTLSTNAWLNANGQLTNTTQGVLLTATSGDGSQAAPYEFDIDGNLNMGSYTILGNTANNTNQYSATWRVTGSVTGAGNFDSYTTVSSTYGGNVRIEAGGTIALNRVYTHAKFFANAGSVYLWATGTVTIATYIDTRSGGGTTTSAGSVTIRSEGPVAGQGIAIQGTVIGYETTTNSILAEARFNSYTAVAGGAVSLYCQTNITLAGGISTRGGKISCGAILIRGSFTDANARAGAVAVGVGVGAGLRADTVGVDANKGGGGNVTVKATSLHVDGRIDTRAICYQTRTGNVDIDVTENVTVGGYIDTRLVDYETLSGSPGYVKILARRTAVLGVDAEGYSIRTRTVPAATRVSWSSAAGDADVTLTGVDTSAEIYDPANPTNSMTSSIYVAGKIDTGRWYNDNALGNIRITAVEVQLGGELSHATLPAATGGTPTLAIRYGETTYGVVTHLRENGVYWNGSGGHNIAYTTDRGAYTYTADVPYAGVLKDQGSLLIVW